ncbi:splicing factor, arginine/serine-rich 19-like [Pongo abelii]|uniref:splicing factor, arginine/serine-rich 19-like n=1 Tax=Pongo abelii TaxID=9601 RepID=UPI0030052829
MMLPLTRLWPLLRWGTAAAAGEAAAGGSPTTTTTEEEEEEDEDEDDEDDEDGGERPALPAEAPGSPAPSAAEARGFFRGGGEAPPVSESEEEEAEARVSSPREAVVGEGERRGRRRRGRRRIRALSPPPPGGSSGCAARGSRRGAPRGGCGGAGPAAGLSPGSGCGGGGGGGRQRRQLPPLSSGPLRSAPWCVDSSPSCCLMESRRSRHRKCLYCPPHSLPVAGHVMLNKSREVESPLSSHPVGCPLFPQDHSRPCDLWSLMSGPSEGLTACAIGDWIIKVLDRTCQAVECVGHFLKFLVSSYEKKTSFYHLKVKKEEKCVFDKRSPFSFGN